MNTRIAQSEPAPGGTAPGRFSSGELAFLIAVPLLWAILLLFHPGGEGDEIYLDVQDNGRAPSSSTWDDALHPPDGGRRLSAPARR